VKNQELAAATREAEKLLREISDSTALAEKEKLKVAVIVEAVSKKVGGHLGGSLWRFGAVVLSWCGGLCCRQGGRHHAARCFIAVAATLGMACLCSTMPSPAAETAAPAAAAATAGTAALPTALLQAEEIAAVKQDAERDLAEAKPALDAALAALNSITPKDIGALKALKNPPDVVKRIFDCVLVLRCAVGGWHL
jgi:hypothetical protein